MRRLLVMTAAGLMLLGVMPTTAAGQTGSVLIEQCGDAIKQEGSPIGVGYCLGLVKGVSNMHTMIEVLANELGGVATSCHQGGRNPSALQ